MVLEQPDEEPKALPIRLPFMPVELYEKKLYLRDQPRTTLETVLYLLRLIPINSSFLSRGEKRIC